MPTDFEENHCLDEDHNGFLGISSEKNAMDKYKTEICRNWELGNCEFGKSCMFAHGLLELRDKKGMGNSYKTKKCKLFHEQGYCYYGNRCQFKHRDFSAETASSPKATQSNDAKRINKKRLQVFVNIVKNE